MNVHLLQWSTVDHTSPTNELVTVLVIDCVDGSHIEINLRTSCGGSGGSGGSGTDGGSGGSTGGSGGSTTDGSGGSGGGTYGGSTGGTSGGSTGTGDDGDSDDTDPIGILPPRDLAHMILGLSDEESEWLFNHLEINDEIKAFLSEEEYSNGSKNLAVMAINAYMNGGVVNLDERLVYDPSLDQDYRNRMAEEEKTIFNNLSTAQKTAYLMSAQQATNYSESYYPNSLYNGNGDAVRHSFWNALSTVRIGVTLTKKLTDAHESDPLDPNYPNHFKEKNMDLFNNNKGREIALMAGKLYQLIETALENGDLRKLTNLASNGKATIASNLVPTP
ncbi:hypothetical protein [Ekhidna sp.]|uniref:DUF6973 domain-containing protein n=1 Tax=Ekhidna sp. TaxID=2608089 RepID=UPI003298E230